MTGIPDIRKDRLRYTKNTTSSKLAYLAILFDVLYFVTIYHNDVGNYYYSVSIGISVICNLLFMLTAFLCSEGVKGYKMGYSVAFIPLGIFQIIRIFGIPSDAHSTIIHLDGSDIKAMSDGQFTWVCICLIISALSCFIAAAVGINKTKVLRDYEKQISNK